MRSFARWTWSWQHGAARPFAIYLFFPVIPVIKVDFQLTDALAQLAFSIGVLEWHSRPSPTVRSRTATDAARRSACLSFSWGSLISAVAGSFIILLIGRLVQSIGAGCGITLAG